MPNPATELRSTVLVVTFKRPRVLARCLYSLKRQVRLPEEVVIVYQADDEATMDITERLRVKMPFAIKIAYCETASIVDAANVGLMHATGDVVCLIDDDAVAPRHWMAKMMQHYLDPGVGAVGGPVRNVAPDPAVYPIQHRSSTGKVFWFGRICSNMHDLPPSWCRRSPIYVDHLMGANMSLRRQAFDKFEQSLKSYWYRFELDACLQVKSSGYRIVFDFANVMKHYPVRQADCVRGYDINRAYNEAFVLSKHSQLLLRPVRLLYILMVGTSEIPGILYWPIMRWRHGPTVFSKEVQTAFCSRLEGWRNGARMRKRT
jgi:GT2 family glycosyltransferase